MIKKSYLPLLFILISHQVICLSADTKMPNIILIMADNLNPDLLSPYGNTEIRTPNIQEMASAGMLFSRAYAVSGVCSPTRASLLTGLLPSQTGVHNALPSRYSVEDWSSIEEFRNLPQTLSDAGYRTGLVGKYHLGQPDTAQLGFDYWVTFPSGHTNSFHGATIIDNGRTYWEEETHLTDFWTKKAEDFIQQSAKQPQPFFLFLSYNGPYNLAPVVLNSPDNRHASYYKEHVPSSPQEPIHPFLKNFIVDATLDNQEALKGWRTDEKKGATKQKKHTWAELAWATANALNNKKAMINIGSETQMIDDGVGAVLTFVEKMDLAEDTIVIFTSDQGAAFGQHGLWGNSSQGKPAAAYDENMHIPLIIKHTGEIAHASKTDAMVSLYDLLPTLLDYIGLKDLSIDSSPGRSFADVLIGKEIKWEGAVYFDYIQTRAIRTHEWKYVKRFLTEPNELYDLSNDPDENHNLIHDSRYKNVINKLDNELTIFFATYADNKYDLWQGGTGKAVVHYGGRNEVFEEHFSDWKQPYIEKAKVIFRD